MHYKLKKQKGAVYHIKKYCGYDTTLDGRHTFCVPEQYEPGRGSGGSGLCNEFGIRTPIGYDEAKVGDQFPKIGTGLLKRKSEEGYDFFTPYEVEPFPVFVNSGTQAASPYSRRNTAIIFLASTVTISAGITSSAFRGK